MNPNLTYDEAIDAASRARIDFRKHIRIPRGNSAAEEFYNKQDRNKSLEWIPGMMSFNYWIDSQPEQEQQREYYSLHAKWRTQREQRARLRGLGELSQPLLKIAEENPAVAQALEKAAPNIFAPGLPAMTKSEVGALDPDLDKALNDPAVLGILEQINRRSKALSDGQDQLAEEITEKIRGEVQQATRSLNGEIRESNESLLQSVQAYFKKRDERSENLRRAAVQTEVVLEGASSTFSLLSVIAHSAGNAGLGNAITATGHLSLGTYGAISEFSSRLPDIDGNKLAQAFNHISLISNLANVFLSLPSLFGPSADQLILEQIVALRRDVADLRQVVQGGLQNLDRKIDRNYQVLVNGFSSLQEQASTYYIQNQMSFADLNVRVDLLSQGVTQVLVDIEALRSSQTAQLHAATERLSLNLNLVRCLEPSSLIAEPADLARTCLDVFYTWAVINSRDRLALESAERTDESASPSRFLPRLARAAEAGVVEGGSPQPDVDVELWASSVNHFLDSMLEHPRLAEKLIRSGGIDESVLVRLAEPGRSSSVHLWRAMHVNEDKGRALVRAASGLLIAQLRDLASRENDFIRDYVGATFPSRRHRAAPGFDQSWTDVLQPEKLPVVSYIPEAADKDMRPCDFSQLITEIPGLKIPHELKDFSWPARAYLYAERLGLGVVRFCYVAGSFVEMVDYATVKTAEGPVSKTELPERFDRLQPWEKLTVWEGNQFVDVHVYFDPADEAADREWTRFADGSYDKPNWPINSVLYVEQEKRFFAWVITENSPGVTYSAREKVLKGHRLYSPPALLSLISKTERELTRKANLDPTYPVHHGNDATDLTLAFWRKLSTSKEMTDFSDRRISQFFYLGKRAAGKPNGNIVQNTQFGTFEIPKDAEEIDREGRRRGLADLNLSETLMLIQKMARHDAFRELFSEPIYRKLINEIHAVRAALKLTYAPTTLRSNENVILLAEIIRLTLAGIPEVLSGDRDLGEWLQTSVDGIESVDPDSLPRADGALMSIENALRRISIAGDRIKRVKQSDDAVLGLF